MATKEFRTVEDVEGPWVDTGWESGLIERCKQGWRIPVTELPDDLLAVYLRQRIALSLVLPEAQRRVAAGLTDGSEMYEGELADALTGAGARERK